MNWKEYREYKESLGSWEDWGFQCEKEEKKNVRKRNLEIIRRVNRKINEERKREEERITEVLRKKKRKLEEKIEELRIVIEALERMRK